MYRNSASISLLALFSRRPCSVCFLFSFFSAGCSNDTSVSHRSCAAFSASSDHLSSVSSFSCSSSSMTSAWAISSLRACSFINFVSSVMSITSCCWLWIGVLELPLPPVTISVSSSIWLPRERYCPIPDVSVFIAQCILTCACHTSIWFLSCISPLWCNSFMILSFVCQSFSFITLTHSCDLRPCIPPPGLLHVSLLCEV